MPSGWLVITARTQHYPLSQDDAQEVSQRSRARKEAGFVVAAHGCTWLSVKPCLAKNSSLQVSAAPEPISPESKSLGRAGFPHKDQPGPWTGTKRENVCSCLSSSLSLPLAPTTCLVPLSIGPSASNFPAHNCSKQTEEKSQLLQFSAVVVNCSSSARSLDKS